MTEKTNVFIFNLTVLIMTIFALIGRYWNSVVMTMIRGIIREQFLTIAVAFIVDSIIINIAIVMLIIILKKKQQRRRKKN